MSRHEPVRAVQQPLSPHPGLNGNTDVPPRPLFQHDIHLLDRPRLQANSNLSHKKTERAKSRPFSNFSLWISRYGYFGDNGQL